MGLHDLRLRREAVLDDYAALKAHGRAIYYATRDWLEETDADKQERCRNLLGEMLSSTRSLFVAKRDAMAEHEERVYACFSNISQFIKTDLRGAGLASGEVSRCNQYLSKMMFAFEQIGQDDVLINAEKFMDRLQAGDIGAVSGSSDASNDLDHRLTAEAEVALRSHS